MLQPHSPNQLVSNSSRSSSNRTSRQSRLSPRTSRRGCRSAARESSSHTPAPASPAASQPQQLGCRRGALHAALQWRCCHHQLHRSMQQAQRWQLHAAQQAPPPASPEQQQQQQQQVDPEAAAQLMETLAATQDYKQLARLVEQQQLQLLQGSFSIYALLQAAALRDTLPDQLPLQAAAGGEAGGNLEALAQAEELIDALAEAVVPHLSALPLITLSAVALALSQLGYYSADVYEAIAAAVLAAAAAPGPASASSSSSSGVGEQGLGREQQLPVPGEGMLATRFVDVPGDVLPGVVLSFVAGFSLNGHYQQEVFDALVQQVLTRPDAFADPANLTAIATALVEVQHYSPPLLQLAAARATATASEVSPQDLVSLLLALAFFRVAALEFVQAALEVLQARAAAGGLGEQLGPKHAAQLWRFCVLHRARTQQDPPAALLKVLQALHASQGELLLLGPCPGPTDPAAAANLKASAPELYAQWEEAGLLAPAEMLAGLQQLGLSWQRGRRAGLGAAGGSSQQAENSSSSSSSWVSVPVDISLDVLGKPEEAVAAMVLSEERYCHEPPSRLRGQPAIDISVLQALGWRVLPLPVPEWLALEGQEEQQRYLQARLQAALGGSSS